MKEADIEFWETPKDTEKKRIETVKDLKEYLNQLPNDTEIGFALGSYFVDIDVRVVYVESFGDREIFNAFLQITQASDDDL